jgi:hypothetical protein
VDHAIITRPFQPDPEFQRALAGVDVAEARIEELVEIAGKAAWPLTPVM